jgi:hypothetical protein
MRTSINASVRSMAKLTPETPPPKTKLLTWIETQKDPENGKPLTIARFAVQWGVSTLWLIANGRVRATYDNGVRIEQGTRGYVSLHDVCGPAALLPVPVTPAKRKRKRTVPRAGKRSAARPTATVTRGRRQVGKGVGR